MNTCYETLTGKVDKGIDAFYRRTVELNDFMAANPELGNEEFKASRMMAGILSELGFDVEYPFAGIPTSFCGTMGNGKGPKVALMVEYDALPEIGHACGHCLHGSMSILAAAGVAEAMKDMEGTLLVIGTPAEETNGAKVYMAEQGVFDGVDLAMMIHCHDDSSFVRYRSLAMDAIKFEFKGKTAHAAGAPWDGLNALNGVQLLFHGIDMLRQHIRSEARMHGIILEGGLAPNIVPEKASAGFYFRAPTRQYLNEILDKVYNVAKGSALATGTSVSWDKFEVSFDNMVPNDPAESMMEDIYRELGIPLSDSPGPMGSSDVGNVSQKCPAIQPVLSITDHPVAAHTREFASAVTSPLGYEALEKGARALARACVKTLTDENLRERIHKVFSENRA
jgi:amidohydrolase